MESREVPLLIIGFNRPAKLRQLIDSLRVQQPQNLVVSLDGPRIGREMDAKLVSQCRNEVALIDWPCSLEVIAHEVNLGLRKAVQTSVSQVVDKFGSVIVLEDDVVVGPQFLEFMRWALDTYAPDKSVMHINGYNVVPKDRLARPMDKCRLTRYPESFAWATWERAWRNYDESLTWALEASVGDLGRLLGSSLSGMRWKLNFQDAHAVRINTWAYRWIASIWQHRGCALSPNRNLVTYNGYDVGTHTRLSASWPELPIEQIQDLDCNGAQLDIAADQWVGRTVFGESVRGNLMGLAASSYLGLRHRHQRTVLTHQ